MQMKAFCAASAVLVAAAVALSTSSPKVLAKNNPPATITFRRRYR